LFPKLFCFLFFREKNKTAGYISCSFILCFSVTDSQDTIHFVVYDHKSFVYAHAGFRQNLYRLCRHSTMYTYLCTAVCFAASAALICANTFFLAVQNGFDGVVYTTQVRGLDLDHVTGFMVCKQLNIFQRIAPLVRYQFYSDTAYNQAMAVQLPGHGIEYIEIPRYCINDLPVSASHVRALIQNGMLEAIRPLVPDTTFDYFLQHHKF